MYEYVSKMGELAPGKVAAFMHCITEYPICIEAVRIPMCIYILFERLSRETLGTL